MENKNASCRGWFGANQPLQLALLFSINYIYVYCCLHPTNGVAQEVVHTNNKLMKLKLLKYGACISGQLTTIDK